MVESEIQFPIRCPICRQEFVTAFRLSVVADGLMDGDIRLYANCHVVGWDASAGELEQIRRFLDAQWGAEWQEACEDFSLDDLSGSEVGPGMAFPMPMEEGDHAVIYPR